MRKLLISGATLAVGVIAALGITQAVRKDGGSPPATARSQEAGERGPGPIGAVTGIPVETSSARAAVTTSDIRAIGSLQSDESVRITPEVAGRIAQIAFQEGEQVKEGDVLVKLDDSLARAEVLDQEARYALAKANLERANQLARTGSVTERGRDEAKAAFDSAGATLELARARLEKLTILAPFSGVVGLRAVSIGAFLNVGTVIVNLEKIDALKVDFNIPELFLADVGVGQSVQVSVDALPNRTFAGTIYAIDPMVDVNGRALKIRARLPNADRVLRPGLFARITVKGPQKQAVVVVPESAIVPRGSDSLVYRIEDGKAVESKVRLGERKAGHVVVLEGLAADTIVVTAGQQRLRNGATVQVVTSDPRLPG